MRLHLNKIFLFVIILLLNGCKPEASSKDSRAIIIPKDTVPAIRPEGDTPKDTGFPTLTSASSTDLGGPIGRSPQNSVTRLAKKTGEPLEKFFQALSDLEKGRRPNPVRILQLGDSHTAGDRFSGRLRSRFEDRFGDSGRGLLPAGIPFVGYRPVPFTATMSSGWKVNNSFNPQNPGPYGLTGFRLQSKQPDQSIGLAALDTEYFERIEVEYLRQPNGGSFDIIIDGEKKQSVDTSYSYASAQRFIFNDNKKSHKIEIITNKNRPVDILNILVEKNNSGIVFNSAGISGATENIIERWDSSIVDWELKHLSPDLIILAYGTNEGYAPDIKADSYGASYSAIIEKLRLGAPTASILIVGPPDGEKQPSGCGASSLCIGDESARADNRHASGRCAWIPPTGLNTIRQTQRNLAIENNYEFWDWSHVMGGSCGTHRWSQMIPPLARPDHIHFTADGYMIAGDDLFEYLMKKFKSYKINHSAL